MGDGPVDFSLGKARERAHIEKRQSDYLKLTSPGSPAGGGLGFI